MHSIAWGKRYDALIYSRVKIFKNTISQVFKCLYCCINPSAVLIAVHRGRILAVFVSLFEHCNTYLWCAATGKTAIRTKLLYFGISKDLNIFST